MKKRIITTCFALCLFFGYALGVEALGKAAVWIDNPIDNSVLTGTEITINGWVMSPDSKATLKVFFDETEVTTINRIKRDDVVNSVTGYGDKKSNPLPGFDATFSIADQTDGKHTITVKMLSETGEVLGKLQREVQLDKNKTALNIDTPNTTFLGDQLHVGGWIMSGNQEHQLKIYLDQQEIKGDIERIKRDDVLQAVTGYGGSTSNPLPGYDFYYDVTNINDGLHELTVQAITPGGDVIAEKTTAFTLEKYRSTVYIDGDFSKEKYVGTLGAGGWAMTTASKTRIEAFVDGKVCKTGERIKRDDVLASVKGYGDKSTNSHPGFNVDCNLETLKEGTHTLTVNVVNEKTNEILATDHRQFTSRPYRVHQSIDAPNTLNVKGTSLHIGGWAMMENPSYQLEVYIDDLQIPNVARIKRDDVLAAVTDCGKKENNPLPGYDVVYNSEHLKDGKHIIKTLVKDREGNIIDTITKTIYLKKYKGTAYIDNPKTDILGTRVEVNGWYLSDDVHSTVEVDIDGALSTTIDRIARDDVVAAVSGYGDKSTNPLPGFNTFVDVTSLSDGPHQVNITIKDQQTGDVIATVTKQINIKKYDGALNLDTPKSTMYNNNTTVHFGGWAMSQIDGSYLKVYIDDREQQVEVGRCARQDVIDSFLSKVGYEDPSKNPTPGFNVYLNFSSFTTGTHQVTLKLYSKFNEEIASLHKDVYIYTNLYPGIDVSYYQGNIDWTAVHNDGIKFAMIRLGYRGYGTSGIMKTDDKAVQNVHGATNAAVKVGLYFFSQAVNYEEGIEEANYVLRTLQDQGISNKIQYPIAFDSEYSTDPARDGRADRISNQARTAAARGFLETIRKAGYQPMLYASKSWLYDKLDLLQLQGYDVWLAHYTSNNGSLGPFSDYTGPYQIWQYTSKGTVNGIYGDVDLDLGYREY